MTKGTTATPVADWAWRVGLRVAYRALLAYCFVARPRRRAAYVAVWRDGHVLAIRNSYRHWVTLPAGGLQRGEDLVQCAQRELREEVGLEAPREALRFVAEVATTCEYAHDVCAFFELHVGDDAEPRVDRREVVWAGFMAPRDVLRARVAPPVRVYLERYAAARA